MKQIDNLLIWKNKVDLTITDKIYDLVKRDIKFQEDQFRGWYTKGLMIASIFFIDEFSV